MINIDVISDVIIISNGSCVSPPMMSQCILLMINYSVISKDVISYVTYLYNKSKLKFSSVCVYSAENCGKCDINIVTSF